jgi:hypothetical protein
MKSVIRMIIVAAFVLCVFVNATVAQRAIPDDNLAYPVLVQSSAVLASGFFLNTDTSTYLVTAKHVLFDLRSGILLSTQVNLLSYPHDPKESGRNIIVLDLAALSQAGEVKPHPREDVVVVRIAKVVQVNGETRRMIEGIPGVTSREMATSGLLGVGLEAIKKYDDVLESNEVLVFGYPTSIGIQELPQLDPLRPLLRRGIVAGRNPKTRSLVLDCPTYPGNSGGPVVEIDRSAFTARIAVIGVVRESVPYEEKWLNVPHQYVNRDITNSGYTIVTPMDYVLEIAK